MEAAALSHCSGITAKRAGDVYPRAPSVIMGKKKSHSHMGWGVDSRPHILLQRLNLILWGNFIREFLQGNFPASVGAPLIGEEGPGAFSPCLSGQVGHDVAHPPQIAPVVNI